MVIQTPRIPPGLLVANELGSVAGFGAENPVVANRCWREEAKLRIADWKGVKNRIYLFFLSLKVGTAPATLLIGTTRYYLWIRCAEEPPILFMNKVQSTHPTLIGSTRYYLWIRGAVHAPKLYYPATPDNFWLKASFKSSALSVSSQGKSKSVRPK